MMGRYCGAIAMLWMTTSVSGRSCPPVGTAAMASTTAWLSAPTTRPKIVCFPCNHVRSDSDVVDDHVCKRAILSPRRHRGNGVNNGLALSPHNPPKNRVFSLQPCRGPHRNEKL